MIMNELNWNFHVDMVLLTLNEMHCRYVEPSPVEEDP